MGRRIEGGIAKKSDYHDYGADLRRNLRFSAPLQMATRTLRADYEPTTGLGTEPFAPTATSVR
jgi:hypothetical protein